MEPTGKKPHKMVHCIVAVIAIVMMLLHFFPVYRILDIGPMTYGNFFSDEEIAKALYIGSVYDRIEARSVLRLANEAFNDVQHTKAENKEKYGLLAYYAIATDVYDDVAFNKHSLKLLSAHLDKDRGWIWVYYSSEAFHYDGSLAYGSSGPSLWTVERDDNGEWVVVQIHEPP